MENQQELEKNNIDEQINNLNIQDEQNNDNFQDFHQQNIKQTTYSAKDINKSMVYKKEGNELYNAGQYNQALEKYEEAVESCPLDETKQLAIFHSNISLCYMKLTDYDGVIHETTLSLKFDPEFKKALLNRSTAFEKQQKYEDALEDLKSYQKLDPNNVENNRRIPIIQKKVDKLFEERKTEVIGGLKDLGNTILGKFGMSLDNFNLQQNENGSYNIQYDQGKKQK